MDKKFELTGVSKMGRMGVTVHQIRATEAIPARGIRKGDVGGWVESELLRNGDARVSGNAWVFGDARVYDNALVSGNARVSDKALVFSDARVFGNARVFLWER